MFIFADKTNNIYEMPAKHHEKLLKNYIKRIEKHCQSKQTPSFLKQNKLQ